MGAKAITEMIRENNLATTGDVTVDGPWGPHIIKDRQFPIFVGEPSVENCIGTATARINNSLKFEIEFIPDDLDELPDDFVGTFEVLMLFHVRKK
jgi:hypothetical protein